MKAVKILTALVLLTSAAAHSTPRESRTVTLSVALGVDKCEGQGPIRLCTGTRVPQQNIDVILQEDENTNPMPPYKFFQGNYITLYEIDGIRYIGVIEITKSEDTRTQPSTDWYSVNAEILDTGGQVGRMFISVANLDDLNFVTLQGEYFEVGDRSYIPRLTVGPKFPNPVPNNAGIPWTVEIGTLK